MRPGLAGQARHGEVGRGWTRLGAVRYSKVWQGTAGKVWHGLARIVVDWCVLVRIGRAWYGR